MPSVAARTGQVMARLGRALVERPLLRAAVRSGEVSIRAAQEVLLVAVGADEAAWVERARARARALTVRGLVSAVRDARASAAGQSQASSASAEAEHPEGEAEAGEPWQGVSLEVTTGSRDALLRALDLAGRVLGESAPRWQRLEAVAQEYLGAHGCDEADDEVVAGALAAWRGDAPEDHPTTGSGGDATEGAAPAWRPELEAYLEEETRRWAFLEALPAVAAPALDEAADPAATDATLRELAALRERWASLLGHLALLVRMLGLWRDLQFVSFAHYCRERLGLGVRQVEQRIALERRLHAPPSLRMALAGGRLDAERARLVARVAEEPSAAGWIDRAERTPTVALRREVEALEAKPGASWMVAAQRCAPEEVVVELRRDHHRCQVPGCSRAAVHAHHVRYRSRGGGDEAANLVSLCAAHHLHGVHRGFVRVSGAAPDRLTWELGGRGEAQEASSVSPPPPGPSAAPP